MIVGYNYPAPCNRDGNWIGPPDRQDHCPPTYATLWKELPFKKQIAENLKTLRDNGVQVVRWFFAGEWIQLWVAAPRSQHQKTR